MKYTKRRRHEPFRVRAEYKLSRTGTAMPERDAQIERCAGRQPALRGLSFPGVRSRGRYLEFEFATRLPALLAALRITETCRGVKCEVIGRIWP